jgi:hypothetical protein
MHGSSLVPREPPEAENISFGLACASDSTAREMDTINVADA